MIILLTTLLSCQTYSIAEHDDKARERNITRKIESINLYENLEPMVNEKQLTEEEEERAVEEIIFKMSQVSPENIEISSDCDPFFSECSIEILK